MSTWQIISEEESTYRWQISDNHLYHDKQRRDSLNPSPSCLSSSMEDLLLQARSQIEDSPDRKFDQPLMFETGSGRSAALKQSSVAKALSVIGRDDNDDEGKCSLHDDRISLTRSLFQTASGKTVRISSGGLFRAKELLEMEETIGNSNLEDFRTTKLSKRYSEENLCFVENKRARVRGLGPCNATSAIKELLPPSKNTLEVEFNKVDNGGLLHPQMGNYFDKPASVKFHTAGGRSISVSRDALRRARSLLGDPDISNSRGDISEDGSLFSWCKDSVVHHERQVNEHTPKSSTQSLPILYEQMKSSKKLGSNLFQKSNNQKSVGGTNSQMPWVQKHKSSVQKGYSNISFKSSTVMQECLEMDSIRETSTLKRSVKRPCDDIKNTTSTNHVQNNESTSDVRQLGMRRSTLPFKRPRSSKLTTPMFQPSSDGVLDQSINDSYNRKRVSTQYPFHVSRPYMKEFFAAHPTHSSKWEHLSEQVRQINPDTAENYVFPGKSGTTYCSIDVFSNMIVQSGAFVQHPSKRWVANHYKWIVWKLACYERCFSTQFHGKFLSVINVLEELKYRCEREANHGHRSAVKRILEGHTPASSLMVLCISAIRSYCYPESENQSRETHTDRRETAAWIELTDGWYSVDAQLDMLLSQYLAAGKLFVGQKLQICGAGLLGWNGPVSPLEASNVSLVLHANGTRRACWSERLGLCRGPCIPLAFKCIKGNGGPVPRTLVGVMRIYPVLYREKLRDGRYIVKSEKMEAKSLQLHEQRCSDIIEGVRMSFQGGIGVSCRGGDHEYEEGAKIMKMLDGAAEPELIMADMTPEQLTSLTTYQRKVQLDLHNCIQKALDAAGLMNREVIPFMRIRVVGLVKKNDKKGGFEEGLITLWNPTEKQILDLSEGQAYAISGLMPFCSGSNLLYLQARGSAIKWQSLTSSEREVFLPFFNPRKSILLSRLGEVSPSREFDTVALILHVGEVYIAAHEKRQWVFVTDGSIPEMQTMESCSLLAISYSAPCVEGDSESPINCNLVHSIVGFCNLVMRSKDQVNDLWVAEASENSTYHVSFEHPATSHLKHSSLSVQRWADISGSTIKSIMRKVRNNVEDSRQ